MNSRENCVTRLSTDILIIGASAAGCTAAILYAQAGLRVALVEKRSDLNFHKKVCTHYIQSSCRSTLLRVGLKEQVEAIGAVPTTIRIWTKWGWIYGANPETDYGYNIRREYFDPLLRTKAINTPGIEYFPAYKLNSILYDGKNVSGAKIESLDKEIIEINSKLVVGADGRESAVAKAANVKIKTWENNRFSCFAIFKSQEEEQVNVSKMWLMDPNIAYQFPNDNGTILIALMPTMDQLAHFKENKSEAFLEYLKTAEGAPNMEGREPLGQFIINSDNANFLRGDTPQGLELIGDALLSSDPLFGLGISWALLSAEMLVDATSGAILNNRNIYAAQKKYRQMHAKKTAGHLKIICDISAANKLNWAQRLLFSAAARSKDRAKVLNDFLASDIPASHFVSLSSLMKAATVNIKSFYTKASSAKEDLVAENV